MGIDLQSLRFILLAKQSGVNFSRLISLGRQHLSLERTVLTRVFAEFDQSLSSAQIEQIYGSHPYADNLFRHLGAADVHSLDATTYEGATHVADLNHPLPDEIRGRYTMVLDGGTLEHVFDVKQTMTNVGSLLSVGGHFISIAPTNNFTGHGFYQFSPELYFRIFSEENGFEMETAILSEVNADASWFEVADPAKVGHRIQLVNNARTYVLVRACKRAEIVMFAQMPQQSDYQAIWEKHHGRVSDLSFLSKKSRKQAMVEQYLPRPMRLLVRRVRQATRSHFQSPFLSRMRDFKH